MNIIVGMNTTLMCQGYKLFSFTDEQGLTSNLVKTIVQDNNGYILSGTDDGVVLYDGNTFHSLSIDLPSIYVKSLFKTTKGEIVVVTDNGAGYLQYDNGAYHYHSIIRAYPYFTDTALFYPKGIYEDTKGNLWFSDQNSVNRVVNGKIKKYVFAKEYGTDSYFRSFLFAEDGKELIVSSWRGFLFRYNERTDSFERLAYSPKPKDLYINQISSLGKHKYLLATRSGLLEISLSPDGEVSTKQILNLEQISCFRIDHEGRFIIGTWTSGAFIWDPETNKQQFINRIESKTVNAICTDREGAFWFATDEGICVLKKTVFATAELSPKVLQLVNTYIRSLVTNEKGSVFFSDQEYIYRVIEQPHGFAYEPIHNSHGKRVYSFDTQEDILWVSYRNGELFTTGGKTKLFTTKETGGRISNLEIDQQGNCWGFVEQANKVICIDRDHHIRTFHFPLAANTSQLLKNDDSGELYFIYSDQALHIFHFDRSQQKFTEVTYTQSAARKEPFILFDFYSPEKDVYYFATSIGLLVIRSGELSEGLDRPTEMTSVCKAIYVDRQKHSWLGTENGLILTVNNQEISFNKNDGLPNSVIVPRGIVADNRNRLWVATASGIAYWQAGQQGISNTVRPALMQVEINNKAIQSMHQNMDFPGYANFRFRFTSITYPNRVRYETRLLGIKDSWSDLTTENVTEYFNLPPGDYIFQVRAQQAGEGWSEITEFHFSVSRPWYLSTLMLILYVAVGLALVGLVTNFIQKKQIQRVESVNKKLAQLVNEKTRALLEEKEEREKLLSETQAAKKELEETNTTLTKTNALKNDLLSITAHDLKNPLGNIMAYSKIIQEDELTKAELQQFLSVIHDSAINMLKIISELLDAVVLENTNFELDLEIIDLQKLTEKIIALNEPQISSKNQQIVFDHPSSVPVKADPKWVKEAIENLLSNAIKYSPSGGAIKVSLNQSETGVELAIADSGPGFTENDKQQLYGKFKRLSAKPTGGESSTGLGLSIVKEIVSLHGWEIMLDTTPGKGSTFTIKIPPSLN